MPTVAITVSSDPWGFVCLMAEKQTSFYVFKGKNDTFKLRYILFPETSSCALGLEIKTSC